jgi:rubrerythrin
MKILFKNEIPPQTCRFCESIMKLKYKDLKWDYFHDDRNLWKCPLCKTKQKVHMR